ncbi:MAG: hypothetical protein H6732_17075 [Alphaproteobacteria bacterium]|nr:hypothetical protein [Alphaproteobacteria bacterium]
MIDLPPRVRTALLPCCLAACSPGGDKDATLVLRDTDTAQRDGPDDTGDDTDPPDTDVVDTDPVPPPPAPVLIVIDNSASMADASTLVAAGVGQLMSAAGPAIARVGVTTLDIARDAGALAGGSAVAPGAGAASALDARIRCDAACAVNDTRPCAGGGVPSADQCADALTSAAEEPLEAVFLTLCRAVDRPPAACFDRFWLDQGSGRWVSSDPGSGISAGLVGSDTGTAADWLGTATRVHVVVVTDEGDQSRRLASRQPDVAPYAALFDDLGVDVVWHLLGPTPAACAPIAADWGVQRLQAMVTASGGTWHDLFAGEPGCEDADVGTALAEIGAAIAGG